MMDEYRNRINEIHAPKALVDRTLSRIHEEENASAAAKPQKRPGRRKWVSALAAVAAVAVVAVGLNLGGQTGVDVVYNTVPGGIVRSSLGQETRTELSAQEYCDYLGLDVESMSENAAMTRSEFWISREGETVIGDEGTVYYDVDGSQVMVSVSKTIDLMPDYLAGCESSEIDGVTVVAGVSENGMQRTAAFEWEGIHCFLLGRGVEEAPFEMFLLDVVETLKNSGIG